MRANRSAATTEHERRVWNGWLALFFVVLWFVAAVALFLSVFGLSEEQGVPQAELDEWRDRWRCRSGAKRHRANGPEGGIRGTELAPGQSFRKQP